MKSLVPFRSSGSLKQRKARELRGSRKGFGELGKGKKVCRACDRFFKRHFTFFFTLGRENAGSAQRRTQLSFQPKKGSWL